MADVQIDQDAANIPAVNLAVQGSDPTAPGSGHVLLYVKAGTLYVRLSDGTVASVGGVAALPEGRLAIGDGDDLLSALALGTEGDVVTADANGFATWAAAPSGGGATAGMNVFLPPQVFTTSSPTVPVTASNSSELGGVYYIVGAGEQNSYVEWTVSLPAGTYTIQGHGPTANNQGIWSLRINGTEVGTVDRYSASLTYNVVGTVTGVVIAADGLYTFRVQTDTKNGSSSAYYLIYDQFRIWKTA